MNEESTRNPTLDDVALLAKVSSSTVSRYLNNPKVVAAETAERIRNAIQVIGYVPNLLAGGLASSKSKMVAVLIPHLVDSLFSSTIEAMVEELSSAGTTVMLCLTGGSATRTDDMILAAIARRVDAIISTAPASEDTAQAIQRFPGLFIQIWELPENPPGMAVGFSHRQAGRDLARFLRTRGYRLPMMVSANGSRARMRRDGFVEEWARGGGAQVLEAQVDSPSRFSHARRVFADLRREQPRPDVVVCGSDFLAQGVIIEAQAVGMKVPDQLAVIGFGNASVASDMRPTITTVDIDGTRIAREVIAAIHNHTAGLDQHARSIDVGFRLIARESA